MHHEAKQRRELGECLERSHQMAYHRVAEWAIIAVRVLWN